MSGVGDSFTERTRTSWFARIGKSIAAVLFGLVLLAGSSVLLFWNEGRAVQTERSLAEGRVWLSPSSPRGLTRPTKASSSTSTAR
jgi:hypothetical protein